MTIHDNPDVPPMWETCRSQELVQHASPHRDFGCKLIWYDLGKLSTLITLMFQTPKRDKKGNWGFRVYNCLHINGHIWAVIHPKPRPCFCVIDCISWYIYCISCVESKRAIIPMGKICCVVRPNWGSWIMLASGTHLLQQSQRMTWRCSMTFGRFWKIFPFLCVYGY